MDFKGCVEHPAENAVTLTTSPFVQPTHWGQQVFPLYPLVQVCDGDTIEGTVLVARRTDNQRLLNVKLQLQVHHIDDDETSEPPFTSLFQIE